MILACPNPSCQQHIDCTGISGDAQCPFCAQRFSLPAEALPTPPLESTPEGRVRLATLKYVSESARISSDLRKVTKFFLPVWFICIVIGNALICAGVSRDATLIYVAIPFWLVWLITTIRLIPVFFRQMKQIVQWWKLRTSIAKDVSDKEAQRELRERIGLAFEIKFGDPNKRRW